MKIQDIKNIILNNTDLSEDRALLKAQRVALGSITLESVIGSTEREITEMRQQSVYVPYGSFYTLGMEDVTINRKVTDITKSTISDLLYGTVKIAGKKIKVYAGFIGDIWTIA